MRGITSFGMRDPENYAYQRDDARRLVRVVAHGSLTFADFNAIVDRQAAEGSWEFGLLYDLQRMSIPISSEDAVILAGIVYRHLLTLGPRGPVAVVTTSFEVLGSAQAYAFATSRAGINVQVFWNGVEAEQWLESEIDRTGAANEP